MYYEYICLRTHSIILFKKKIGKFSNTGRYIYEDIL